MAETNVTQNDRLVLAADMFAAALQRTTSRVDALARSVGIVVQAIKGVRRQGNDAATVPGGAGGKGGKEEETNDKLKDWARSVGAALESAFNRGKSALFSLVEAADPSAMSTFHASVTMLQQAIGEGLAPYVDAASRQIQQWAKWFRNLDGDTKATIIRISLLVGSLGGLVMIGKTLVPVIMSAVSALRLMGAVAMMSPVGAIVGLTAAVAGLAAAWYSVAGAAKDAGGAMGSAGSTGVAGGPQVNAQATTFAPEEMALLPEKYRVAFKKLDEEQQQAERTFDAVERKAKVAAVARRREETFQTAVRDIEAFAEVMPKEFRDRITDKAATLQTRRDVVRDYLDSLTKRVETAEDVTIEGPKKEQQDAARREEFLKTFRPIIEAEYDKREKAYRERVGPNADAPFTTQPGRAQEFTDWIDVLKDVRQQAIVAGKAKGIDINEDEARAAFGVTSSNRDKGFTSRTIPPRKASIVEAQTTIAETKTVMQLFRKVSEGLGIRTSTGGQDDFLQNLKSPVQSRFTDPFQYAESVQTAVLNQGDADAKILADRMAFLAQKLGDAVGMVEKFMQSQQRQSASSWLGGVVTITDR